MEWTALSFDGNPRALLHIVARARVIPAVGRRPAGPRPRKGRATHARVAPLLVEPCELGRGLEIGFFNFQ